MGVAGVYVHLPSGLKDTGSEAEFPAWKRSSFSVYAKQCGLFEAFATLEDTSIADVGMDLSLIYVGAWF